MYMIHKDGDKWYAEEMAEYYLANFDDYDLESADQVLSNHDFVAFADDPLAFADKLGIPHDQMNVSESTELA